MLKWKQLSILLLSASLLGACSLQSDLNKTIDAENDIKRDSQHLSKRTDDLENELVGKESPTIQVEKLDALFGDGAYSQAVNLPDAVQGIQKIDEPTLLLYAGFSIEAMHFQYWKGDFNEDLGVLDDFFAQSLEILFVHSSKHIPHDYNVNVMIPDRGYLGVASLGAKLDRLQGQYVRNMGKIGMKPISAYDVVITALKDRGSFTRSENVPKAVSMVLQWKQEAIYMLQLRHNYLPMTVLARMSNLQDLDFVDRAIKASPVGTLDVDVQSLDPEQLKTWMGWLNSALETREQLRAMGIEPQYNTQIFGRLLKHTRLNGLAPDGAKNAELRALQTQFISTWNRVVGDYQ